VARSRDALSPPEAVALLAENLAHAAHEFWAADLQVPAAVRGLESALQTHQQLTDAYLLALAKQRTGGLATFDRGLRTLAGRSFETALEIVQTR
jgi:predicted nucleic acid-binding protein